MGSGTICQVNFLLYLKKIYSKLNAAIILKREGRTLTGEIEGKKTKPYY